ncbi:Pycsar system effector family protein [Streptomyces johnsoniae]|uniref:DUF5706 domain-containing protein n=1 Tax=Streptomyces johnsoniae TaxID=3075532 RepID=A0ABU2SAM0_9ACTN|nr:Pycsar system effector family protein [Streptomyces sp. DSM 41886]MDT0445957.1 DUF5706 domain-containing protein [Streptomyces sp. DSM 41886]
MSSEPTRDVSAALDGAFAEVGAQIARTDSKASILLAFCGAVLAGVLAGGKALLVFWPAAVAGGLGAALLAVGAGVLLSVVRPRLKPVARGSLLHWASLTPQELRESMAADHRHEAVAVLARLAVTKHQRLQRAVDLIRAAGALLALAAVLAIGGAL